MRFQTIELEPSIQRRVDQIAEEYNIQLKELKYNTKFEELIHKLHEKTGKQVVILVDEYDKPITDVLKVNTKIIFPLIF